MRRRVSGWCEKCGLRARGGGHRCAGCIAKLRCAECGCYVLRLGLDHCCPHSYEVMVMGITAKARRIYAADPGAAAVAVADLLGCTGKLDLASGEDRTVLVRRRSTTENFPWLEVTITAASVTTYHAVRVHPWAGGRGSP